MSNCTTSMPLWILILQRFDEKSRLKNELDRLISERNKLRMKSEASVQQYENSMKMVKDTTPAHIEPLKASHQRNKERPLPNTLEKSSS